MRLIVLLLLLMMLIAFIRTGTSDDETGPRSWKPWWHGERQPCKTSGR